MTPGASTGAPTCPKCGNILDYMDGADDMEPGVSSQSHECESCHAQLTVTREVQVWYSVTG